MFNWTEFIQRHRATIIAEWVTQLHNETSEQYAKRPKGELFRTVSRALEANISALVDDNYMRVDRFIQDISRLRLVGGFTANDVFQAFELFREVVTPKLFSETTPAEFFNCVVSVNRLLAYTIHCFNNVFQELYNQKLMNYTRQLEADVKARTFELQESELKYKTLVEEINDGYFVLQDEAIVFVNPAFCEMHGYGPEEMLEQRFDLFVDPKDLEATTELCRAESPSGKSSPLEYFRLRKDGESRPTEITVKFTSYGHNQSIIGICRDITERVQMEAKMRETERMAYIGRITASLSHEIRNPLSAVKMNLQILNKNLAFQGNDRRRLEISANEVQRLERILEDLLDFAKPLTLDACPGNLNRILLSSVEILESRFTEKHCSVTLCLDPAMPNISADVYKLEQAVLNLLLNACEASKPNAQVRVISRFNSSSPPLTVEFSVTNEGAIPDHVLPEIFTPFFTTKSKGTGLGLTNVKRVAEAHGGSVSVEHEGKSHTVFRVRLPYGSIHG